MSIRYGQKVSPNTLAGISSSFLSYNRANTFDSKRNEFLKSSYVRDSDLLPIPTITSSEQKCALLIHISDDNSNFLALSAAGNYTVDWGDGVTENFASGVSAYHTYNYATFDPSNTTLTANGFKQAIAIITPQAGQNLTSVNLTIRSTSAAIANVYSQPIEEVYISSPNLSSLTITGASASSAVYCRKTKYVNLINSGTISSFASLFQNMLNLQGVDIGTTASITNLNSMFSNCNSLRTVNFSSNAITSANTTTTSMFAGCYSLATAPMFDTSSVTAMAGMFQNCFNLTSVPFYNTEKVTNMSSMFQACYNLTSVPLFNTVKVTNTSNMFANCSAIATIPLFNTISVTNMSSMFTGCFALSSIPLLNTANVTLMSSMFSSCYNLTAIPLFDTSNVTNMSSMFRNCYNLKTIPLLNTSNVTNMSNMFQECSNLLSVPLLDTIKVTNMATMFFNCFSLVSVPDFNTPVLTTATTLFGQCYSLVEAPVISLSGITDATNLFSTCYSLRAIPAINCNSITNFSQAFNSCFSNASAACTNIRYTTDFTNNKLSKEALETIFTNLGTAATGATRTLTLTNNWGAPTPVSLTGTTSAGSITIAMANTAGLSAGMQVTGTNTSLTTGRSVTFTDTGDLVNLTAHGLSNGDEVSFSVITTTTGIVINTIYFVVNASADSFQVASTLAGSALPLTSNGSGTIKYNSTIVSIVANTSVTMSRPMAGSATQTLAFRQLGTYKAILKGFAITG